MLKETKSQTISTSQNIQTDSMEILHPDHFADYELIDCGDFEKLERFGSYITIRPEPQAVWDKGMKPQEWEKLAHVRFMPNSSYAGSWKKLKPMPDEWEIEYSLPNGPKLKFHLALTSFKHVGIFPEQAVHWDYIYEKVKGFNLDKPKFLNLFAYTGGASLAAKAAGADVTHLDAIRQVVTWARQNMELSNLKDIRWLVEDAMKYVRRELKRGTKYNGIILDPPAYGHGPNREQWKLEENINEMVHSVLDMLDEQKHILILNTYSLGFSSLIIENLMAKRKKELKYGELYLQATSGYKLPLGVFGKAFRGV
ncbi:MAG TPA: class I SAM-dependent methyltransferase [Bacteroidia bacterium]|jgi:23S rRNA (cytosine1962-C5)-methyltransferase|nr:class I SAM-dependent methyltransferase [Bacteroidia bacterium]